MDLDGILAAVTDGIGTASGDDLLGVHLVGARALGAAGPDRCVEVVAITADRWLAASSAAVEGVGSLDGWRVGISWAPAADLRSPMTVGRQWPGVVPGSREVTMSARHNTLAGRWVLRERGVAVVGAPASTYVAPVDVGALRAEMIGLARSRAEEVEEQPALLHDEAHVRALVGTLCGALFTAYEGEVTHELAAASWAHDVVGPEHRPLVRRVMDGSALSVGPEGAAAVRAFAWEAHRMVGAEALRQREE